MRVLGIDPGFTGALAIYDSANNRVTVMDMPVIKSKTGRTELNMNALFNLMRPPVSGDIRAVIEQVSAMPGQGVTSTFRFGQGYGAIQMALAAHKLPVAYVTPAVWKRHYGLSRDKGLSRGLAIQRFPENADYFQRVKDDGRAEAALIALYGYEKFR